MQIFKATLVPTFFNPEGGLFRFGTRAVGNSAAGSVVDSASCRTLGSLLY